MSWKPISSKRSNKRKPNSREPRRRFLIVCEGETEKTYFDLFRASLQVVSVGGGSPSIVVKKAQDLVAKAAAEYDSVWCVFDRDTVAEHDFKVALEAALKAGFQVAYSNPCFELWYLLHFELCHSHSHISCETCANKIGVYLPSRYKKNEPRILKKLQPHQQAAIERAKCLLRGYVPHDPATDNPYTKVHELVEQLLHAGPSTQRP